MVHRKWLIFSSIGGVYFFSHLHRIAPAVIASRLMEEFKASAAITGLMSSSYFYPYAIAQIPTGLLLDRIGVRKTVTLFSALAAVGSFLFALSPDVWLLTFSRALVGFGAGGIFISALKAFAEWFDPREFATMMGFIITVGSLGAITATSPLAFSSEVVGWRSSFLMISIAMALATALCWAWIRPSSKVVSITKGSVKEDVKRLFSNKNYRVLLPIPFLTHGAFIGFQGLWGGPFLIDVYEMSTVEAGNLLLLISLGVLIGAPSAGLISDRVFKARKPVLLIGLSFMMLFWILITLAPASLSTLQLAILMFTLGFSFSLADIYMAMSKDMFPESLTGIATGIANFSNFMGATFFQLAMGVIIDLTLANSASLTSAYLNAFSMCLASVVISTCIALTVKETFPRKVSEMVT
ncbi:MAG: hypothetical protein DRJ33_08605 [Candidatus Methanomethylicota archaeon]|uniref:Lysosomal dipeptide transporter MFSD1 n=1 Tax=Thermoproteota archaeon TaxID=2056631 RepID=A0A497EPH4_9CREN|nr:MAG: hypothetical protein DRJ33_08605 [Candidatus Verstraetearchaeota archaeon]